MWRIGGIELEGRVVLGPMSGFTFPSYRDFMRPFGVAADVTEMTSAMGVLHDSDRTSSMYVDFDGPGVTGLQLFGGDAESVALAAEKAIAMNPRIAFVDLNMGCPIPKVLRSGSGSALLDDPEACGRMVRAVKERVEVPVTVKIRLGRTMESVTFRKVIEETESAGADAVTLHARTAKERYSGEPHYDMMEGLRKEMSVPLIVSGNIYTLDDAVRAVRITGAEGVMVARGGVGNPWLVKRIDEWFRHGGRLPDPTVSQQVAWCRELSEAVIAEKGETAGVRKLRSIAPKFVAGCRRCKRHRYRLATEPETAEDLYRILDEIDESAGREVSEQSARCGHAED